MSECHDWASLASSSQQKHPAHVQPANMLSVWQSQTAAQAGRTLYSLWLQDGTEKRTKDTYGPPMGKKLMVFLDDLNMPRMDQYGTQQPIALLKLLIDRKVGSWDVQLQNPTEQ